MASHIPSLSQSFAVYPSSRGRDLLLSEALWNSPLLLVLPSEDLAPPTSASIALSAGSTDSGWAGLLSKQEASSILSGSDRDTGD